MVSVKNPQAMKQPDSVFWSNAKLTDIAQGSPLPFPQA